MNFFSVTFTSSSNYPRQMSNIATEPPRKRAVLLTRETLSWYNFGQIKKDRNFLHMMETRVCLIPYAIYFRKNSFLSDAFNNEIMALQSNGLITKWKREFIDFKLSQPEQIKDIRTERTKLTLHQVEGVFEICGYLYIFAFVIFLFEIVLRRLEKLWRKVKPDQIIE